MDTHLASTTTKQVIYYLFSPPHCSRGVIAALLLAISTLVVRRVLPPHLQPGREGKPIQHHSLLLIRGEPALPQGQLRVQRDKASNGAAHLHPKGHAGQDRVIRGVQGREEQVPLGRLPRHPQPRSSRKDQREGGGLARIPQEDSV